MSEAYASTLSLSFDIRGGLLRQMRHWAAAVFVAAMLAHSLRIFFTGAFAKPREINWLIGVAMLLPWHNQRLHRLLLPDDLLSGHWPTVRWRSHRSIPVIGTWASSSPSPVSSPASSSSLGSTWCTSCWCLRAAPRADRGSSGAGGLPHPVFGGADPRATSLVTGLPVYAAKAGGFFLIVFGVHWRWARRCRSTQSGCSGLTTPRK